MQRGACGGETLGTQVAGACGVWDAEKDPRNLRFFFHIFAGFFFLGPHIKSTQPGFGSRVRRSADHPYKVGCAPALPKGQRAERAHSLFTCWVESYALDIFAELSHFSYVCLVL